MISIEKIFAYVIKVSFLISAPFFLAALFIPKTLMCIFTNEPQLIASGIVYLRVVSLSYLFTGISQIYLCILKNTGCAVKSMVIGSTAVIINIFLNAALIYGLMFFPEMGIAGAALATSISKLIEMGWAYMESLREKRARLRIKYCFKTDKNLVQDYWKYTMPMLGDYLVWGCGFTTYSVIMGHLGSDAVAANSIANIVKKPDCQLLYRARKRRRYYSGQRTGNGKFKTGKRIRKPSLQAGCHKRCLVRCGFNSAYSCYRKGNCFKPAGHRIS